MPERSNPQADSERPEPGDLEAATSDPGSDTTPASGAGQDPPSETAVPLPASLTPTVESPGRLDLTAGWQPVEGWGSVTPPETGPPSISGAPTEAGGASSQSWPWSGQSAPEAPFTPAKARKRIMLALATLVVVAAMVVGVGLGRVVWPTASTPVTSSVAGNGSGGGTSSSGNGFGPFGNGSGSGGSSSSGNTSTGAGAPSDISSIAAKVSPALVDINTNLSYQNEQAAGTGMVLTSNGEVLTNNHVIEGATSISVTDIGNGKTYSATVVGYDRTADIAVLKLSGARDLQTISISSASAAVGQAVVGVGNAGGTGGTPSAVGGSITAVDQSITASDSSGANAENLTGLIEVNADIQAGDSGGSLVNASGQVIGMDTAASSGSGYQISGTQAYAIPIATALSVAHQIVAGQASSTVHIGATGFLGLAVSSSSSNPGEFGGSANSSGAVVSEVLSGSAAGQAGVVAGDTIDAVDGSSVNSPTDLSNLLESKHPGDTVQLQWTDQSGQTHSASVQLGSGPPA